ncbi:MAG TPA: histidine phosphatase family protein [Acidimicrobiales bacterium]|jgi:probable phosphoglycerate mutase|nr:histidine phosphatase family protein [Acidimicrobiales bacterium]
MELLLIRHALPVRVEGEGGTSADPELAPRGHEQAEALAEYLAGEHVDSLYVSPLRRARQTAEHVSARLGLEAIVDDELAEFDRHAHFYIPIEELREEKDERWDDLVAGRWGVDGEVDPRTFMAVVVEAIERVIAAHSGQTVAIVCHGGVINAYYADMFKLDFPMFFEPAYTSISRVLASSAGHRQMKSINEHAHVRTLL